MKLKFYALGGAWHQRSSHGRKTHCQFVRPNVCAEVLKTRLCVPKCPERGRAEARSQAIKPADTLTPQFTKKKRFPTRPLRRRPAGGGAQSRAPFPVESIRRRGSSLEVASPTA